MKMIDLRSDTVTMPSIEQLLIAGAHLTHSGIGSVSRVGNAFAWNSLNQDNGNAE